MGCGASTPEAAIEAAGPAEAAALLGRHVGDAALAAAACDRIGALAREGEEGVTVAEGFHVKRLAALGAAGAAGLLVDAMRAHPGDVDVQYNGISALRWLLRLPSTNRAAAVEAWAVEALVAALRVHPPGDPLDVLV